MEHDLYGIKAMSSRKEIYNICCLVNAFMLRASHVEHMHAILLSQVSLPYLTYCTAALQNQIKVTTRSSW